MVDKQTYQRAYKLEKEARKNAERILEEKSLELYALNSELERMNRALKVQQKKLVQAEKFVALGQLSAGIAHEINNPLAFVISNISTLEKYWKTLSLLSKDNVVGNKNSPPNNTQDSASQSHISSTDFDFMINDADLIFSEVNEGLSRVKDIVANLKSLARTKPGEVNPVSINACIDSALTILKNEIKFRCDVEFNKSEIPTILANEGELTQVFINLILNAAQAIRKSGWIKISSKSDEAFIKVSIEDNGIGIPKEDLDKIFNPFYTSKPVGQGTGLGLSVSFSIIENLNGTISVKSELGKGTQFLVLLPIDSDSMDS